MRISDTLDQLLRSLLVTSSTDPLDAGRTNAQQPGAPPASTPDEGSAPLVMDLGAAAAEVAIKRAHELDEPDRPAPGVTAGDETAFAPDKTAGDLPELEASAGAAENLGLGFHLGAAIERIALAAGQGSEGRLRLREAKWLIERYISLLEQRPVGADLHASSVKLARTGETIAGLHEMKAELADEPEPADRPAAEPEPHPESEPADTSTVAAAAAESPEQPQIVHELPSIRRELLVTTIRAGIAVAAVTVLVFVLTLIAQWH